MIKATAKCISCKAPIFFALTDSGAKLPMNPATLQGYIVKVTDQGPRIENRAVLPNDIVFYTSHFSTCPNRKEWGL